MDSDWNWYLRPCGHQAQTLTTTPSCHQISFVLSWSNYQYWSHSSTGHQGHLPRLHVQQASTYTYLFNIFVACKRVMPHIMYRLGPKYICICFFYCKVKAILLQVTTPYVLSLMCAPVLSINLIVFFPQNCYPSFTHYILCFCIIYCDMPVKETNSPPHFQTCQPKCFKMCDQDLENCGEPKFHNPSICKSENVWQKSLK